MSVLLIFLLMKYLSPADIGIGKIDLMLNIGIREVGISFLFCDIITNEVPIYC